MWAAPPLAWVGGGAGGESGEVRVRAYTLLQAGVSSRMLPQRVALVGIAGVVSPVGVGEHLPRIPKVHHLLVVGL